MTRRQSSESYFVARLAERGKSPAVAAPSTIDSICCRLTSYLSPEQIEAVRRAHAYAEQAHRGQIRRTGHAYISHPLAVASILADLGMDHETLMAALLHDVIEDSDATLVSLSELFGPQVAALVDGVSKLSKIFHSRAEAQAENFQKMALAMAKDIRVIMVKLADRLHNMRTIGVMSSEQRRRIARETLDYYAPIANRLGIHAFKVEFEELGFEALYPLRSERIAHAVQRAGGHRKALVEEIETALRRALEEEGCEAEIIGREKHLYSIYRKMKTKRKSFSEIMDVFGFRIITSSVDNCYRILGIVHNLYKPVAGRFKDYIAIPKVNGYQSLHTTLFGMHGVPIEVQIRTSEMDTVAQNGIAGHWLYKGSSDKSDSVEVVNNQQRARQWVRELLDLQQKAGNPLEFIESLKIDLFPDEVYVFTPVGDILELARGACPIDFAYAIHTDIGNRCVACRIDRNLAPLSQPLQSGQSVEIITAEGARPNPDWLTFVVSGKARAGIRQALKAQHQTDSVAFGRRLLNRSLAVDNKNINDFDFRRLRRVFTEFGVKKLNELLAAIGTGDLMAYAVAQRLLAADNPEFQSIAVEAPGPLAIRGGEGLVIKYGRCCGPVPGDAIVGRMTPGTGFVVHIETCSNMQDIRRRAPKEIIPAHWAPNIKGEFLTLLRADVNRKKGVFAEIAATIADCDANVENLNVEERDSEISSVSVCVGVQDRNHLARIMRRLHNLNNVLTLTRASA